MATIQDTALARERFSPATEQVFLGDAGFSLSESNHRIANNLALLSSAISIRANEVARRNASLNGEEVSLLLAEVGARISTVAWLHRFLAKAPDGETVDLSDHLDELCETLISALSEPRRVTLVKSGDGACTVATSQVVPLSLIVTEIVTNSLKYAHPTGVPGKIALGCRRQADGSLVVEVSDDGVGLPEGFDIRSQGGIGARTIRVLARQLGADFDFHSASIGVRFILCVPPRAA
jgi:two-component sensor histidine kinase